MQNAENTPRPYRGKAAYASKGLSEKLGTGG